MKLVYAAALCAGLMAVHEAHAGWGAIAFNPNTGATAETHEYGALADALDAAMRACGGGCLIVTWEHNKCIAFAVSPEGIWGSFSNAPNQAAATNGALKTCNQPGCAVKQVACN